MREEKTHLTGGECETPDSENKDERRTSRSNEMHVYTKQNKTKENAVVSRDSSFMNAMPCTPSLQHYNVFQEKNVMDLQG